AEWVKAGAATRVARARAVKRVFMIRLRGLCLSGADRPPLAVMRRLTETRSGRAMVIPRASDAGSTETAQNLPSENCHKHGKRTGESITLLSAWRPALRTPS